MAKMLPKKAGTQDENRAAKDVVEFKSWKDDLKQYWPQIDKNQEMYEFYKREESDTSSNVSLNTAFSMIESQVAKANDSTLHVTVKAKGLNGLEDFEEYVAGVTKDSIEDPDVATIKGSFRKIKEVFMREFLVKGNAAAEVQYLYKESTENGQKVVLADNPYTCVLPLKSVVFNPSAALDESDVYYIEKYVSLDSLKKSEYKETEEADGQKSSKGLYKNLDKLELSLAKEHKLQDADDDSYISGDKKVKRKVEPIRLLERWEGPKLRVIANDEVIVREEDDPKKIGGSGLVFAMNYKIQGRPYAYGEIDAIYPVVRAQDTIINQAIESVNRYLRPSILVKDTNADLDEIITLLEDGGVGYGDPATVGPIQATPPPAQAFSLNEVMQQAIERAGRYSPYAAGVPSQSTDKTSGTATGITRLQAAAEPNFKVKLDTLEDSFMQPLSRIYLKMIANHMLDEEIRYGLLRGKNPGFVRATKGILQGQATIGDLITVGLLRNDPQAIQTLIQEYGLDPQNYIDETEVFDVDWIISAKLDNQSEADIEKLVYQEQGLIQFGLQMGVQFEPERTISFLARKRDIDDIQDLFMTDEEKQAQMQQMQAQQQQQMEQQAQMQSQQQAQQAHSQMQSQQAQAQAKMEQQQMAAQQGAQQQQAQMQATMAQKQLDVRARLAQEQIRAKNRTRA